MLSTERWRVALVGFTLGLGFIVATAIRIAATPPSHPPHASVAQQRAAHGAPTQR